MQQEDEEEGRFTYKVSEEGAGDGLEEEEKNQLPMQAEVTREGVEVAADEKPLIQFPVIKTDDPPQGGRNIYDGAQVGDINPVTKEVVGAEGMLPGRQIFKGLLL